MPRRDHTASLHPMPDTDLETELTTHARERKVRGFADREVLMLIGPSLLEEDQEPVWQEEAVCRETDPEIFYPEKGGSTREAKAICRGCPVREPCLNMALANDERFGIWGGFSERERRSMKRGPGRGRPITITVN